MLYKELGDTQVKISAVGQGTIGAGGPQQATPERMQRRVDLLGRGIELGMTFLDTGEDYEDGLAEELLGKAVAGRRDRVFISSKFKPQLNSFAGVQSAIEGSLKRLRTDYIDLYQVQWPNPAVPVTETMSALASLVAAGKVRFIGVCNFTVGQLEEARAALAPGKLVSVQVAYNLYNRSVESALMPYCRAEKMTVIAYNLNLQGARRFSQTEAGVLMTLAAKYGVTVPQIVIGWAISRPPVIALTGTMDPQHLAENAAAADLRLAAADIESIDRTFARKPVEIPTGRIRVVHHDADATHRIYTTLDEAIANPAGLQPGPSDLAEEIRRHGLLQPVEVVHTGDTSGRYDYDLIHGRNRYWAWIIAYGHETPIPACIANGDNHTA
jgi:aryl-alcohol dehydrogenase-like predicted oxidoreductase